MLRQSARNKQGQSLSIVYLSLRLTKVGLCAIPVCQVRKRLIIVLQVDMSQLPCGLNGVLYCVQMDSDGGVASFSTNGAGAKYGTGYCDAKCPQDLKFIDGKVRSVGRHRCSRNE